ncbi:hypothetical protein [Azospirillum brasilense]|uniref:hypothetical protein n=1 Tax=Azospirillum brasilense TaxID=192 RepID=UPI001B3B6C89|nr:hypothetical protein [Azospirillum brasilense]
MGGIPVVIAALIAVSAWILLERSGRSREAAVLAGTVYREMIAATAAPQRLHPLHSRRPPAP